MTEQKINAEIVVADGAGGMRPVVNLRFEEGEWPIQFDVPADDAEAWMAHFDAEIQERGWARDGISQMEATENSGTCSVRAATGQSPPTLHLVWKKSRNDALRVKARLDGVPVFPSDLAREFIGAVSGRVQKKVKDRAHRAQFLAYRGLPWRGELWLGNDIRLGPPSQFPPALMGPQVIILNAMVEGIGAKGIAANFGALVRELRIFFAVTRGSPVTPVQLTQGWVTQFDEQLRFVSCTLQQVGYSEDWNGPPRTFPVKGDWPLVPHEAVTRPGLGRSGIWPDMTEQWVPADIEELWQAFVALPFDKRENFLRAGNAFSITHSMWPDQKTAYAAMLVVACEALKPPGKRFKGMNIYDVVASLIGKRKAARLRELTIHPQDVRSGYVHRGELAAGELVPMFLFDEFADPSFDGMLQELYEACRICLIEWLRCAGQYEVVWLTRPGSADSQQDP